MAQLRAGGVEQERRWRIRWLGRDAVARDGEVGTGAADSRWMKIRSTGDGGYMVAPMK